MTKALIIRTLLCGAVLFFLPSRSAVAQDYCAADCDANLKVDLCDLVIMKGEFLADDCASDPCSADCNGDNQVNLADLVIMKEQFLRTTCPACDEEGGCSTSLPTTSTTAPVTTTVANAVCGIEIALGRECPASEEIDDPAYGRPGRRGLAATCNDIIDFTVCSDCVPFDPACLVWTIEPAASFLSIAQIDYCCWRLTIDDSCEQIEKVVTYTIIVTDTCNNGSDCVEIDVGTVMVDIGKTAVQPDSASVTLDLDLINPVHSVRALTLNVAACDGGADYIECNRCEADPNRARDFTCSASEQADGTCRIVMYATDPSSVIAPGRGSFAEISYSSGDGFGTLCGDDACIDLCPINIEMVDQFNEDLCVCSSPGEVCFRTCGDVYPRGCFPGCCGDGVVNLLDVLEMQDIIAGVSMGCGDEQYTPTACQLENGDVPNGTPPYCGNPPGSTNCESDGDIDIYDLEVIKAKAKGIMNCCDYCLFGQIY